MAAADYNNVVQQLYVAYFGRPADPVGLMNFSNSLNNAAAPTTIAGLTAAYSTNATIKSLIDSFGTSTESATLYTGSTAAFVNAIFTNVLGRSPALEGLLFWSNAIDSGALTRGNAAAAIMAGAQSNATAQGVIDAAVVANKVTVAANFTAALDSATEVIAYSGASAAQTARSMLATVTNTTDTTAFQTTVTTTVQAVVDLPVGTGSTYTLTNGADTFIGTSGNDNFTAGFTTTNGMTFGSLDSLDGGAGTDTVNIVVDASADANLGTFQANSIKNIETVSVTFGENSGDASIVSLLNTTGVTTVETSSSLDSATFTNIGSATTALKISNGGQAANFGFTAASLTGTADTASLTLSNVTGGAVTLTSGFETVAITSSGAANTIASLSTTAATKLTVAGTQNLTITANMDASIVTVDANTATGGVDVDFGAGAVTATGGAGNDSFSFEAAGAVSATGGAGNDTFTFDGVGTFTTADTVAGGDGTDTLISTAAEAEAIAAALTNVSGLEVVRLSGAGTGGATLTASAFGSGVNTVTLAGTAAGYTVTMNAGSNTVNLGAAIGGTLVLNDTGTATTDSVTISNTAAATDVGANQALTIGGFETVTINLSGTGAATAQTLAAIALTADTGGSTTLNFAGSNGITTSGTLTAGTISAAGLTGTAALTMGVAAASVTSITGSANGDTLRGDAASSINGGAGNDILVGGTGSDTLVGGDGNDTITTDTGSDNVSGGAGNDTLTLGDNLAAGDTVDGGDGTDTLSIGNASLTALNALSISALNTLNTNISNVERVTISDDLNQASFDMARLDSINYVRVSDWAGAEAIIGMAAGSTVVLDDAGDDTNSTDDLTLTYADATGTADALSITLTEAANADHGDVTIASIENLTITTAENTASTTVREYTFDLTSTGLTSLTIAGTEAAILEGVAINATTITAADSTGFVKILGGSANQTITGSAAADSINGGAGADTISGGAGADTLLGGTGADSITGGDGADSITGAAGNDTIVLTEATAAVDSVVVNFSEAGANIDTISGFTTTTTGDEIQLSIAALNAAAASGGIATGATVLTEMGDGAAAAIDAAASTVQVLTAAGAVTDNVDIIVLSGATFSSGDEVEDAIETGGAFELTLGAAANDVANKSFIVVYSNGTDAKVAAVHITAVTGAADTNFEAGNLNVIDLVTITGVSSIGASTFGNGNFEFIA